MSGPVTPEIEPVPGSTPLPTTPMTLSMWLQPKLFPGLGLARVLQRITETKSFLDQETKKRKKSFEGNFQLILPGSSKDKLTAH